MAERVTLLIAVAAAPPGQDLSAVILCVLMSVKTEGDACLIYSVNRRCVLVSITGWGICANTNVSSNVHDVDLSCL
jgi:hypothetical protein